MFALLQRSLENAASRVVFSIAIVISLVPHEWMHAADTWFLLLFGPEVLARTLLAFRRESLPVPAGRKLETGWRAPTIGEVALLLLDLVAVVSFVPVAATSVLGAHWLRLFRLTRTVLLLRYWAPIVRDLWEVTWRPERRRQLFFVFGSLLVICFAGAVLLEHVTTQVGDDFDGDGVVGDEHDHEFLVRMWWAFRQLEDPGNLLASPHDTGTLTVSVGLTLAGLFVVSFIIGIGTDVVVDLSSMGRIRPPGLRGHTVIVNVSTSGKRLLQELLHEEFKSLPAATDVVGLRWLGQLIRTVRTGQGFVVLGNQHERPDFLRQREFTSVVYRAWEDKDDDTLLLRGDVLTARRVVLLAGERDQKPDDDTIRTILTIVEQLRETQDRAPRRLLAEIVGIDNLPAAERASCRAIAPLSATVVPTEALISRCVAAVCRNQGLATLLTRLLRSEGREIYAQEVDDDAASLGRVPDEAPLQAFARAGAHPASPGRRVVPLGLVVAEREPAAANRAVLNPRRLAPGTEVRGIIGVADRAGQLTDLIRQAQGAPFSEVSPPADTSGLSFDVESAAVLRQILVCGFRSATVQLLEALLTAEPGASVTVLVEDTQALTRAIQDFEAQGALVQQGLITGTAGSFAAVDAQTVRWTRTDGGAATMLEIVIADWTSPRSLGHLPGDLKSAVDYDLVLFSADGSGESDARNTTGLMTIEALAASRPRRPRVVAEVDDVELAARLNERYRSMGHPEVHVFSIDELRALVLFQSVIVPHFTEIYEALVAPGSMGLVPVRAQVRGNAPGRMPFSLLSEILRAQGRILVAVDERDGDPRGIRIGRGAGSDDAVDLSTARLWVIESPTAA